MPSQQRSTLSAAEADVLRTQRRCILMQDRQPLAASNLCCGPAERGEASRSLTESTVLSERSHPCRIECAVYMLIRYAAR